MSLAATFLAHAAGTREPSLDAAELEAKLQGALAAGRHAWPSLEVPPEAFVRHLAERIPAEGNAIGLLDAIHAGDLYLACACARGDPAAVVEFENHFMSQVSAYLARADALPGFTDELKQMLRTKLFVSDGPILPRITGYTGRGPLGAWLRIAATRTAIDLRRARDPADPGASEKPIVIRSPAPDPELNYLKAKYAEEFRTAFTLTLQGLSPREGNILRLYFVEAMQAPAIGAIYKVSGRSVQRWIGQARQKILDETYRLLRERLKLSTTELGALLAVVESQVDVSILRFLKRDEP